MSHSNNLNKPLMILGGLSAAAALGLFIHHQMTTVAPLVSNSASIVDGLPAAEMREHSVNQQAMLYWLFPFFILTMLSVGAFIYRLIKPQVGMGYAMLSAGVGALCAYKVATAVDGMPAFNPWQVIAPNLIIVILAFAIEWFVPKTNPYE